MYTITSATLVLLSPFAISSSSLMDWGVIRVGHRNVHRGSIFHLVPFELGA